LGGDERTLTGLRAAIGEHRVVRLLYHAPRRPDPEPRDVEPVSLAFLDGAWHLAAYCRLRRGPRLFKLGRIDRFEPLGERFERGERHAMGPGADDLAGFPEARVRFDAPAARWARERQPFTFVREEAGGNGGGAVFIYAVRDEAALTGWLLSWGAAAEVLSPPSLRSRLADEAGAVLARHAAVAAVDGNAPDTTVSGGGA